ncbi:MAG: hemerythrin domain-containing protein [Nitrososphaerota archaeon]|nr:hemerythrin domain-containing protein [Nitrososphaerota archaeon]
MSYKLDYDEPIQAVVERLKVEHLEIGSKLSRVIAESDQGKLEVAISLLNMLKPEILRHAVEEEARIARVIVAESQKGENESIFVLRDHRRITEFLQEKLPHLHELPATKSRIEIREFVNELKRHHEAEERIVFPLVDHGKTKS